MGNSTFSSAVVRGKRLKPWKTKPMWRPRARASWSREKRLTSSPSSRNSPLVGLSRQPTRFMNVLLPEPDEPITATNSPGWIDSVTPRSAGTVTSPIT